MRLSTSPAKTSTSRQWAGTTAQIPEYLIQKPDSSLIFCGGRRFSSTSNPPPLLPRMSTNLTTEHAELGNADDTTIDPSVSKFLHTFLLW
jgi:hypothetical protein